MTKNLLSYRISFVGRIIYVSHDLFINRIEIQRRWFSIGFMGDSGWGKKTNVYCFFEKIYVFYFSTIQKMCVCEISVNIFTNWRVYDSIRSSSKGVKM